MINEIRETLQKLKLNDLPDGKKLVLEGREFSKGVTIGRSLFLEKHGVFSEREYKENCIKEKKIMFHFQYGLTNFEKSAEGLNYIYNESLKRGHTPDRYGLCLDRAMGLPPEMRSLVPRETGLKLDTEDEWKALGRIVPIQPHMGDHIVSSPASVENLLGALSAGITTVGNFSQYFTFEYPLWYDEPLRLKNFVKALGIMSGLKDKGVMIHSNIDDGFCSQFYDRCSIMGWAMMEYYILNDLIGAKLAPCFGNMIDDPLTRMSTITCLDEIHKHECVGSMAYGDTLSPTMDLTRNLATTASYVINDIVMQMHTPTGHAINPLPVTEVIRIPTPEEIVQVQLMGAQLKLEAERQYEITDFSKIEERAHFMLKNSKKFFDRIMDAFSDVIDVTDPLKLIYGLKLVGADNLENMFACDAPNTCHAAERKPYLETGMYRMITGMIDTTLQKTVMTENAIRKVKGKKAIIACTDVHQYGKMIVSAVLQKAGFIVQDFGCNADPGDIVGCMLDDNPDVIVLSTYNGLARSYASDLKAQAAQAGIWGSVPIIMGGRLNDDAGCEVPVDVTDDLAQMGFHPSATIESLITLIDCLL